MIVGIDRVNDPSDSYFHFIASRNDKEAKCVIRRCSCPLNGKFLQMPR